MIGMWYKWLCSRKFQHQRQLFWTIRHGFIHILSSFMACCHNADYNLEFDVCKLQIFEFISPSLPHPCSQQYAFTRVYFFCRYTRTCSLKHKNRRFNWSKIARWSTARTRTSGSSLVTLGASTICTHVTVRAVAWDFGWLPTGCPHTHANASGSRISHLLVTRKT